MKVSSSRKKLFCDVFEKFITVDLTRCQLYDKGKFITNTSQHFFYNVFRTSFVTYFVLVLTKFVHHRYLNFQYAITHQALIHLVGVGEGQIKRNWYMLFGSLSSIYVPLNLRVLVNAYS